VLKRTEEEWAKIVQRTGRARLKEELVTYKSIMPKIDKPV
jgi:hypothetical protein